MGRYQAAALRHCRASFAPHEGHFSLPFNFMREIVETAAAKGKG
jgi:hypothetical protein